MENLALDNINKNLVLLRREVETIKEILEEDNLELADDVKREIEESRKRSISEFISQKEMEKKFL